MTMRRPRLRFTIRRLLLVIAIAGPLSASLAGWATGFRCPLCFSGRVVPVYRGFAGCGLLQSAERGECVLDFNPPDGRTRWSCRACQLQW